MQGAVIGGEGAGGWGWGGGRWFCCYWFGVSVWGSGMPSCSPLPYLKRRYRWLLRTTNRIDDDI